MACSGRVHHDLPATHHLITWPGHALDLVDPSIVGQGRRPEPGRHPPLDHQPTLVVGQPTGRDNVGDRLSVAHDSHDRAVGGSTEGLGDPVRVIRGDFERCAHRRSIALAAREATRPRTPPRAVLR